MLRESGRCGECQAVLHKFQNVNHKRHCDSCRAALRYGCQAYHCEVCGYFACKQCTDASRPSSVPAAPRPQLACGGCQGVFVDIRINRASVNRTCHSCNAPFECITERAYHCDSCTRIMCMQCTADLRRRLGRSGASRCASPFRGLTGIQGLRYSWYERRSKRPRLSPAAGTAESEVQTTEQQPVDTACADEHERAQIADEHERLSPAAGTAESEMCTTEQQPVRRWLVSTSGHRQRWTDPVLMCTRAGA